MISISTDHPFKKQILIIVHVNMILNCRPSAYLMSCKQQNNPFKKVVKVLCKIMSDWLKGVFNRASACQNSLFTCSVEQASSYIQH